MSTILAIDTAGDVGSVALLHAGRVHVVRGDPGRTHLEHVMPLVRRIFHEHGLRPDACDAFAFGSGPGSFTGLRVACTIAQGLAYGTQRPVIPVGNLQALARQAAGAAPGGGAAVRVLAAIDARMDQAYWAVYDGSGGSWQVVAPPALCDAGRLGEAIARWQPQLCAGRLAWLRPLLGEAPPTMQDAGADAGALLRIAQEQLACGAVLAPERAVPDYVRDDVARTVEQRRAAAAPRSA